MRTIVDDRTIPTPVKRELLDSLFGNEYVLHLGAGAYVLAGVANILNTADPVFLVFSLLLLGAYSYRVREQRRYSAARALGPVTDVGPWERRASMGAVALMLSLGLMGTYSVLRYPHSIATTVCFGLLIGSMLAFVGRNFASERSITLIAVTCCLPMGVAFVVEGAVEGQPHFYAGALVLLCVYVASTMIAANLRSMLVDALMAARRTEESTRKFDVALSSMPNGLIMVDTGYRLVVANRQALGIMGLPPGFAGTLIPALRSVFTREASTRVISEIENAFTRPRNADPVDFEAQTADGRWISFQAKAVVEPDCCGDLSVPCECRNACLVTLQDVTERIRDKRDLVRAARYDGLTGLANRSWWEASALSEARTVAPGESVALCLIDVDRFKLINDTLGHHIGDMVIAAVASRLLASPGDRFIPGRLGGDEFAVVLSGMQGTSFAKEFFDGVFSSLSAPYVVEGHVVDVQCSGGVVVRSREDFDLHADLARADLALRKTKDDPNRDWTLFDAHMEGEFRLASRIKHDLRGALDRGEITVVYQPIYDIDGARMISAEALCRWKHFEVGDIPPQTFIAMAEETGMIGKLTEYVLRTAVEDCREWGNGISVSVNLSALDLAVDGIVGKIETVLSQASLPPQRLCVEITETVFAKDFARTVETLATLRDMGVKTSLDDFGTGYSSLSYLGGLPLRRVKIDRSFVIDLERDRKARRMFRGVASLANELGFEVVVEGVENEAQLDYVREVSGVDMVQGYVFSRAMAAADMLAASRAAA